MSRRAIAFFVALLVPGFALAKQPQATLRVHVEANANDGASFSTPLVSAVTGRQVMIEKIPSISEHDVAAFKPYVAGDGTYGALFVLDDHGKLELDSLSIEHRGTFVYVFVNGRPLAELQIDRRISDGKLYIKHGLTSADIALMTKKWPIVGAKKK